ncbi:hypothetical protein HPP92_016811 [Vanilla planifolia]|uniref:PUM-HD domain-containing protein n=1 Tax=Vanilla planifolia TaxID=51239 RepID=A0A835USH6_VANPL|nr:hypothetical protein HPP92_016811 [Vanilla planifolia]
MERLFDEIPKVNTHHASLLLNPDAGFGRINDEVHRSYELNYNSSYIYQPQPYAGVIDRDGGYTLRRGFGETSSMSSSSRSPSPMGNDSVRRSPHYNGHRCVTTAQPEELYLLEQLRSLHIQENANGLRAEPPYWDGYSTLNRFDLSDSFQLDGVVSPHMFCCSDQIANPRRFSCEELHAYGGLNPCSDPKSERRSAFDSLPAEFFLHRNGDRINPNHGVLNSQGPFYTVPNDLHRCLATPDGGTQMLQHMPAQHSAGIQWNTYDFGCDGSFIQQGKRLPCVGCNRNDSRRYTKRFQVYDSLSDEIKYTSFADTMLEMKETIYRIARDQDGCRFLQIKFDEGRMDEINAIFDGVIDHVVELMENTFGNYLMQKLLDVCSDEQRMSIVLMLTRDPSDLVRISLNSHGQCSKLATYALQSFVT